MLVVSSSFQIVKEKKSGREFGSILEVEYGFKAFMRHSQLECSLEDISNDTWKSINGSLVQKLWPAKFQGFEALRRKEYRHIRDQNIEDRNIGVSEIGDQHISVSKIRYWYIGVSTIGYRHIGILDIRGPVTSGISIITHWSIKHIGDLTSENQAYWQPYIRNFFM